MSSVNVKPLLVTAGFDEYCVTPKGKVWDFNATKNEWNIIDHSSVQMTVRTLRYCIDPFVFPENNLNLIEIVLNDSSQLISKSHRRPIQHYGNKAIGLQSLGTHCIIPSSSVIHQCSSFDIFLFLTF